MTVEFVLLNAIGFCSDREQRIKEEKARAEQERLLLKEAETQ